jgi:hypothetical protein
MPVPPRGIYQWKSNMRDNTRVKSNMRDEHHACQVWHLGRNHFQEPLKPIWKAAGAIDVTPRPQSVRCR